MITRLNRFPSLVTIQMMELGRKGVGKAAAGRLGRRRLKQTLKVRWLASKHQTCCLMFWLECSQKITDCCCGCHFYLRNKSLLFSPTLCNTLDFLSSCLSVFLCLLVTAWQRWRDVFSLVGGMSAGVRCLSRHHWLLCVWECVHACVNLVL